MRSFLCVREERTIKDNVFLGYKSFDFDTYNYMYIQSGYLYKYVCINKY